MEGDKLACCKRTLFPISERNVQSQFSLAFTDRSMEMSRKFAQGSRFATSSASHLSLTVTLNQEIEKSLAESFA